MNSQEIEAIAVRSGFKVVYPEELGFADQARLLYQAKYIIAPEGSALFLCYFAKPGAKVCILNNSVVEGISAYNAYLDGCEIVIMNGTLQSHDPSFAHRSDYVIDERKFSEFVGDWMKDGSGPSPERAVTP